AVLRVESTVRHLHNEALEFRAEYVSLTAAPPPVEPTEQILVVPEQPCPVEPPRDAGNERSRAARHRLPDSFVVEPIEVVPPPPAAPPPVPPPHPAPPPAPPPVAPPIPVPEVTEAFAVVEPDRPAAANPTGPISADRVDEEPPTTAMPVESVVAPRSEPVVVAPAEEPQDLTAVIPVASEPAAPAAAPPPATPPAVAESEDQRLQRLLAFVARQEPGLRWAIGTFPDGSTLLVTDLANGWIPSGIELPAGVQLLEPARRSGTATAMLGTATASAAYSPGDRLGWASDFGATDVSLQPRELAPVDDLGWKLGESTHWRDGLPRMANTLARAGAAGTGVADAEIDLLRVHLDTARYQLLAQYPDADTAMVLNCMLLAATEGIAVGDGVAANYHYSWFRTLSAPEPSQWDSQT
ncbi:MAG TPA: DUF5631 domain-containing protein, partial [Mycobacterium sp.]|nr:DUF5631 domain-containing protein [Mycobacterium sp.]